MGIVEDANLFIENDKEYGKYETGKQLMYEVKTNNIELNKTL